MSETCEYPVRVLTDAPWDIAFPTVRECGEPATDAWTLWAIVDEDDPDPRLTRPQHTFLTVPLCQKHRSWAPGLRTSYVGELPLVVPEP